MDAIGLVDHWIFGWGPDGFTSSQARPFHVPVGECAPCGSELVLFVKSVTGRFRGPLKGEFVSHSFWSNEIATSHDLGPKWWFNKGNGTPYFREIHVGEIRTIGQIVSPLKFEGVAYVVVFFFSVFDSLSMVWTVHFGTCLMVPASKEDPLRATAMFTRRLFAQVCISNANRSNSSWIIWNNRTSQTKPSRNLMKQMDSFHHLHFKFHFSCCIISSVFHEVFRSKFFNQIYVNTLCPSKPCPLSKRSSVVLSLPYQLWRMWAGHPQQVRLPRTQRV